MEMVWLELPETGGKQQFPAAAVPMWEARGWVQTDPPAEPDTLRDPLPDAGPEGEPEPGTVVDPAPEQAVEPAAPPTAKTSAVKSPAPGSTSTVEG